MSVRVLGPFEVRVDDHPVPLSAGRLRTLLAVLAMSASKPVSVDHLVAAVWGERLPRNATRSLQTYAGRLRSALDGARIDSTASGFAMGIDPDDVDALRFVRLLDESAGQHRADARRALLTEALGLWRGEPFEGIDSAWLRDTDSPRLVERYLSALEKRIDLDLADGRYDELAAELGDLVARYPLRESMWVRLLMALGQAGRIAEALESYEVVRGRIADELGVEPGSELRRVHAVLVAGHAPGGSRDGGTPADTLVTPRQVPANIERFAGRRDALATLDGLLVDDRNSPSTSVCAITGSAGVGKTTLAVWWANKVADRFPDGQLYVDLCGFGKCDEATDPVDVLCVFLDTLGVPPNRMPANVGAQAGLFRSLLTGKRVLIVLDNARDADQVRPLLPHAPGCLTVITSRNDLAGVVVTEGAHPVPLDMPPPAECRQLLEARLSQDRMAKEADAIESIISSCGRLPLALAIVAARAALNPSLSLSTLAGELHDARDDLDVLDTGDDATNVRAVFSWSQRAITPEAAWLLRLLGLHVAPEISVGAAASLAGWSTARAKASLVQLHRTNLVNQLGPDQYRIHDLLWIYVRELAERHHTENERDAAVRRMFDYYLHTAYAAGRLLDPARDAITLSACRDAITLPACDDAVPLENLQDRDSARAWLTRERQVLLAACKHAADSGFHDHVWRLAWVLTTVFDRQGHWHNRETAQRAAVDAAERLADRSARTRAHEALARAMTRLHQYDEVGLAKVLNEAGWNCVERGDHLAALAYYEYALSLSAYVGDRLGQAESWENLGYVRMYDDDHDQSVRCYRRALELLEELGDPNADRLREQLHRADWRQANQR